MFVFPNETRVYTSWLWARQARAIAFSTMFHPKIKLCKNSWKLMILVCVTVKIHRVGQCAKRFPWLMTERSKCTGVLMRAPGQVTAWQLATRAGAYLWELTWRPRRHESMEVEAGLALQAPTLAGTSWSFEKYTNPLWEWCSHHLVGTFRHGSTSNMWVFGRHTSAAVRPWN